jgi:uncharacterized protein YuzE
MKIRYDKDAGALYIQLQEEIIDFRDPRNKKGGFTVPHTKIKYDSNGIANIISELIMDFDPDSRIRGIEILEASQELDIKYLKKLEFVEE